MRMMRMMGAESVADHRRTVLEQGDDDCPVMVLAYYASSGETPLRWDGTGVEALGLNAPVSTEAYEWSRKCTAFSSGKEATRRLPNRWDYHRKDPPLSDGAYQMATSTDERAVWVPRSAPCRP
jgi:hypothetical protein